MVPTPCRARTHTCTPGSRHLPAWISRCRVRHTQGLAWERGRGGVA